MASGESSHLAKSGGLIETGEFSLPDKWVDEAIFQMPEATCWAKENATAVAAMRFQGHTHEQLAKHFGKTTPTIRKALRFAAKEDASLTELPQRMRRSRWHEDYAVEVAAKKAEGLGTNELVALFGKSDTTIRKALEHAARLETNSE